MREQLEQRLQQLKSERDTGTQRLAQARQTVSDLQATLLQYNGAILVIEEELAKVEEKETIDN